jgi:hypothetical protein
MRFFAILLAVIPAVVFASTHPLPHFFLPAHLINPPTTDDILRKPACGLEVVPNPPEYYCDSYCYACGPRHDLDDPITKEEFNQCRHFCLQGKEAPVRND